MPVLVSSSILAVLGPPQSSAEMFCGLFTSLHVGLAHTSQVKRSVAIEPFWPMYNTWMPAAQKIHLNHVQILVACYEWASRRGFTPSDVSSVQIKTGNDLVFASGERHPQYQLSFDCSEPNGESCWNREGQIFPYTDQSDIPWLTAVTQR